MTSTDLLWTQLVGGLHEVCTHHGEGDAVAVLGGELHALLELVLKHRRVETESEKFSYSVTTSLGSIQPCSN